MNKRTVADYYPFGTQDHSFYQSLQADAAAVPASLLKDICDSCSQVVGRGLRQPACHTQHLPLSSAEHQNVLNVINLCPILMLSYGVQRAFSALICVIWNSKTNQQHVKVMNSN